MKVGFIGLGRMGMPMSRCLLNAGYDLTVHNRSQGKVDELTKLGTHPAYSPAEVTEACDIVLTCLPDVPTVESVFLDKKGIVQTARPGQILVDHSTVSPSTSNQIAEATKSTGATFLDAPISGGIERAASGTLTIMVGGDSAAFENVRPVFESYGQNIRHVGDTGSGSVIKLLNQLLCCVHSQVAAEALLLGTKAGADPQVILDILGSSWGTSFMLSRNGPVMMDRSFADARAPVKLYVKDIGLVRDFAKQIGCPLPLGDQTAEIFFEASDNGMDDLDVSSVVLPIEEKAGFRVADKKTG